jgi:hypothetical protein
MTINRAWMTLDSEDAASASYEAAQSIAEKLGSSIRQRCDDLTALYDGSAIADNPIVAAIRSSFSEDMLTDNVCASCSDAMIAAVLANRVNPMFLTSAGDYEEQERAKMMQRAVEGTWQLEGIWGHRAEDTATDGFVRGLGATYVWPDTESLRVRYERLFPWEVLYHKRDAKRGDPRTLYIVQSVPRDVLRSSVASDPSAVAAVDDAQACTREADDYTLDDEDVITDRVRLVRAFHLPSGRVDRDTNEAWGFDDENKAVPRSKWGHDGRLVLSVDGKLVSDEPWCYDYFPVPMFRPKRHVGGLRGRGIPEQIIGIQLEIVRVLNRIAAITNLMASPFIGYDQQRVNPNKLATNEHGRLVPTRGQPSQALQMFSWSAVPAELWRMWDTLVERAHARTGVSELSASAQRPARVDSAPALQLLADTESLRHTPAFRAWEQYHVDLAVCTTDAFRVLARAAQESARTLRVLWHDDRELMVVDWTDADLEEMRYRCSAWPANLLPKTPAAQIALMFDLVERGFLSPEKAMAMVRFPDLDSALRDANAPLNAVNAKIDAAVKGQKKTAVPSAYTNLGLLLSTALARYQELEGRGASARTLNGVRWLIEQTKMQMDQLAPPSPATPPVPELGAPPGGPPGAPPGGLPALPPGPQPGVAPPPPVPMAAPVAAPNLPIPPTV